ncbi:hypothetical protein Pelo_11495 [Pelomyxa schiedti]|nr:hypothetical protein Pelo_11495 [Pelomyxa schiedti]
MTHTSGASSPLTSHVSHSTAVSQPAPIGTPVAPTVTASTATTTTTTTTTTSAGSTSPTTSCTMASATPTSAHSESDSEKEESRIAVMAILQNFDTLACNIKKQEDLVEDCIKLECWKSQICNTLLANKKVTNKMPLCSEHLLTDLKAHLQSQLDLLTEVKEACFSSSLHLPHQDKAVNAQDLTHIQVESILAQLHANLFEPHGGELSQSDEFPQLHAHMRVTVYPPLQDHIQQHKKVTLVNITCEPGKFNFWRKKKHGVYDRPNKKEVKKKKTLSSTAISAVAFTATLFAVITPPELTGSYTTLLVSLITHEQFYLEELKTLSKSLRDIPDEQKESKNVLPFIQAAQAILYLHTELTPAIIAAHNLFERQSSVHSGTHRVEVAASIACLFLSKEHLMVEFYTKYAGALVLFEHFLDHNLFSKKAPSSLRSLEFAYQIRKPFDHLAYYNATFEKLAELSSSEDIVGDTEVTVAELDKQCECLWSELIGDVERNRQIARSLTLAQTLLRKDDANDTKVKGIGKQYICEELVTISNLHCVQSPRVAFLFADEIVLAKHTRKDGKRWKVSVAYPTSCINWENAPGTTATISIRDDTVSFNSPSDKQRFRTSYMTVQHSSKYFGVPLDVLARKSLATNEVPNIISEATSFLVKNSDQVRQCQREDIPETVLEKYTPLHGTRETKDHTGPVANPVSVLLYFFDKLPEPLISLEIRRKLEDAVTVTDLDLNTKLSVIVMSMPKINRFVLDSICFMLSEASRTQPDHNVVVQKISDFWEFSLFKVHHTPLPYLVKGYGDIFKLVIAEKKDRSHHRKALAQRVGFMSNPLSAGFCSVLEMEEDNMGPEAQYHGPVMIENVQGDPEMKFCCVREGEIWLCSAEGKPPELRASLGACQVEIDALTPSTLLLRDAEGVVMCVFQVEPNKRDEWLHAIMCNQKFRLSAGKAP